MYYMLHSKDSQKTIRMIRWFHFRIMIELPTGFSYCYQLLPEELNTCQTNLYDMYYQFEQHPYNEPSIVVGLVTSKTILLADYHMDPTKH